MDESGNKIIQSIPNLGACVVIILDFCSKPAEAIFCFPLFQIIYDNKYKFNLTKCK